MTNVEECSHRMILLFLSSSKMLKAHEWLIAICNLISMLRPGAFRPWVNWCLPRQHLSTIITAGTPHIIMHITNKYTTTFLVDRSLSMAHLTSMEGYIIIIIITQLMMQHNLIKVN